MDELSTNDERQAAALEFDVFAKHCPSRQVLDHLTGRWGVLVLAGLRKGPARFNALRRRVDGVSEKMLAQTLQALERDGFVRREVLSAMPPSVNYSLTSLGETTADHLLAFIDHIEANMSAVLASQETARLGPRSDVTVPLRASEGRPAATRLHSWDS